MRENPRVESFPNIPVQQESPRKATVMSCQNTFPGLRVGTPFEGNAYALDREAHSSQQPLHFSAQARAAPPQAC